ncbi:hypothetical protein GCM10010358_81170 [Streptomyces minutiscleroticus]|uniref:Transposase n=1 Tax=Streptomyces minutiscleroticus TaxID=68238 RepID=A0A918P366_9ACTN|nr:hypothetical protein GCM10010358_81170 [Streptomyces minutiscleroticus]
MRCLHGYYSVGDDHLWGVNRRKGRSWTGRHHHVTLATAAHAFLTEQRLASEVGAPILTLYQVFGLLQDSLGYWTGTCATCQQALPRTRRSAPTTESYRWRQGVLSASPPSTDA